MVRPGGKTSNWEDLNEEIDFEPIFDELERWDAAFKKVASPVLRGPHP